MNRIFVTLQHCGDLPDHRDWLTPNERARCDGFRFEKRRNDWLLGRWTAKQALLDIENLPATDIGRVEIASAADGAPQPLLDGEPVSAGLSLSHSKNRALCAVSRDVPTLGCDIEFVEARSPTFVSTFFSVSERERIAATDPARRDTLVTAIWSIKESALKALRTGLKADTLSVEVVIGDVYGGGGWNAAQVMTDDNRRFCGVWRTDDEFVLSVAANCSTELPMVLESSELAA